MDWKSWLDIALPFVKSIVLALVVLIVGWQLIKRLNVWIGRAIDRCKMDVSLKPFFASLIAAALKVLLVITVIGILGIDTTSFAAVIAAVGFAVGMAFQGSLSNFAGGVLILTLRPFRVGDYIETGSFAGTVQAIGILYTEIATPDNRVIFIPNGNLSNAPITNHSVKDNRRIELKFKVSATSDSSLVIAALSEAVKSHEKVMSQPEPLIRISEIAGNAVVYTVQIWVKSDAYAAVQYDVLETVKAKFDELKISLV